MNRLSPLIARRAGSTAAAIQTSHRWSRDEAQGSSLVEDAKLFATGWAGGLIFFGTFLG